jgi:hypothetical protein
MLLTSARGKHGLKGKSYIGMGWEKEREGLFMVSLMALWMG